MKRKLIAVVLLLLYGCVDRDLSTNVPGDYLVFGEYYGECFGTCVRIYRLSNNALLEDSNRNYPSVNSAYQGNFTIDRSADFSKIENLLKPLPNALIHSEGHVLGCPDCTDGGGIYMETTINGEVKYWFIDKQRIPPGLEDFVTLVDEKLTLLR